MDSVYFVMAILGCADDGLACREQRIEPARFQSVAACQAEVEAALVRSTDLEYPVIAARCESNRERLATTEPSPRG